MSTIERNNPAVTHPTPEATPEMQPTPGAREPNLAGRTMRQLFNEQAPVVPTVAVEKTSGSYEANLQKLRPLLPRLSNNEEKEASRIIDDGSTYVAGARYKEHKQHLSVLRELFPGAEPATIGMALKDLEEIRNSSLKEFVELVRSKTLSRGEGRDGLPIAVAQYGQHRRRLDNGIV